MKIQYSFFLSLFFLFACNSNTIYEEPEDLIPKDSMVLLLTDMYIAISSRNVVNKHKEKQENYMPLIYKKYKIDSVRFFTSNNYYTSQIEPQNEILNEVKKNIQEKYDFYQKESDILDSIKKAKKKQSKLRRDSIRNARKKAKLDTLPKIFKLDTINLYQIDDYFTLKNQEETKEVFRFGLD